MAVSSQAPQALISVFHKDGISDLAKALHDGGYQLLSTGGTYKHLHEAGQPVSRVEDLTSYPSILGGRVKTLHPKVFGGILGRRELSEDREEMTQYEVPAIDIVVVDLYPFERTLAEGASHEEIIEKIDIGGISLIRAAAKNYRYCWIIPSQDHYQEALDILRENRLDEAIRKRFAADAFAITTRYDQAIANYLSGSDSHLAPGQMKELRYGENPHQQGQFKGELDQVFEQLHGKELSYNNILDADAAVQLLADFEETTCAVIKHNNACGLASRANLIDAWKDALAGDPVSAFGGVLIANRTIDASTAEEMHQIFFELVIAPGYTDDALKVLKQKKNRVILVLKDFTWPTKQYRSALGGMLVQDRNTAVDSREVARETTREKPSEEQWEDLLFASKVSKHTKSNTIVLAKNRQLLASGTGQTSRVDALRQAVHKAQSFNFDLDGSVMASDAFFPFPDSVQIAQEAGIKAVIQPGGSVRDQQSIDYCDEHGVAMVLTGTRHFKH